MLFATVVTTGQENIVAKMLVKKAEKEGLDIFSIAVFEDLRGYIILEAENENAVRKLTYQVPHVRRVLAKPLVLDEIKHLIESAKPPVMSLTKGDIVEVGSGAFKGDQARILRIDTAKEEVTVEFLDAAVPIPVTLKADLVKVVKKATDVEAESK
ncbi:transcription elongation factor Spt5 [Candidatus Micrarchaeota archaeon]|jgi:transcriptional antiterminator NusG|nr:transcription elongation factor Spt5 [Candidatus Micrarchaeota archaeon]